MSLLREESQRLVWEYDHQILWIEPWGRGLRVRASALGSIDETRPGALGDAGPARGRIRIETDRGTISNGRLTATVHDQGRITFTNQNGAVLLDERWRNRDVAGLTYNATNVPAREFKSLGGKSFQIAQRWEAREGEKLFGMGQYQDGRFDLKGSVLELAQRNSQASVPFVVSNRGYGLLWNNPAVGRVAFGMNYTEWVALSSPQLDYWMTEGDSPAEIVRAYADATGKVPPMPEFALGFWQCKLRYKTQEELLGVAREYKRLGLPLSVIVADFFHWPTQGDWKFDPRYWPDPDAMVDELRALGVELMVSIWPTVDKRSENYPPMLARGYLVGTEGGVRTNFEFMGNTVFYDPTNPKARTHVWSIAKKNYFDKGIRLFWLDEAEPEYTVYDFDQYRYHLGTTLEVGNYYPVDYARTFYDGMKSQGIDDVLNLVRCAWAGSQKYGALVWSGDIDTTFESFRNQVAAGLHMGLAGIPWWTTDIGGFGGGDPDDPAYRELLIRWFQYGTFCPVMRLHGFRVDHSPKFALMHPDGSTSDDVFSGGPNEVWSYGDEAFLILKKFLFLRERLKPYLKGLMDEAHTEGSPVIRTLFYEFPDDARAWDVGDQFLLGPDLLVAPVLQAGARNRRVYLPEGADWKEVGTGKVHSGGTSLAADSPLESLPLFLREGSKSLSLDLF
jgi:alpha-D-xyloside xylohydrolase